jgi:hypothetical protein
LREAGEGEESFVHYDEDAFGASKNLAVGGLNFSFVKELAAFTPEMAAGKDEGLVEGDWPEVVHLHMTCHGEDVERAVELAHGLVEQGGYDSSVDVTGRAFVAAVELEVSGGGGMVWVSRVSGEDKVQALWIGGAASEAVAGALVNCGIAFE